MLDNSNLPPPTEGSSPTSTNVETPRVLTPSGDSTEMSSTELTYLTGTHPPIDWNGSADQKMAEWLATHPCSHLDTSAPSFSPNWTALAMKFWLPILISLSLWVILLCGLYVA